MNSTGHDIYTYLTSSCTEPLRDPVWGTIMLPQSFMDLIASPDFQKLSGIRQLGPTYLLYPGAVHTRLNHSVGVYAIARKMLLTLIHRRLSDAVQLPFTLHGIKSFLAAALLHDIGHFPYTHSLKDLPLTSHETLAAEIILGRKQISRLLSQTIGADPEMTAAIIDDTIPSSDPETAIYRSLLSGTLDPDKLDYLNRDAFFCGVPYGLQDVDYILTKIALTETNRMGIEEHGLSSIEHLLFSKYLMYRNVYWHTTVRSATAMIRKALYLGLREHRMMPEDLYGLDDEGFFHMTGAIDYEPFETIQLVRRNQLFKAILNIPYDPLNPRHTELRESEKRSLAEEELRSLINRDSNAGLTPCQVIIDIPEPISLESDVPVITAENGTISFIEAGPVFTAPVIEGFVKALTRIRVFLPGHIDIDRQILSDYFS